MKRFLTAFIPFLVVMFIYWIGGGEFERGNNLGSAFTFAIFMSFIYSFIIGSIDE